ncbi:MAG: DEAD/DEAH box helicase [Desulfobacteraceae bacterium]|nr:DEAD/DEAH box helicase [Desulfobacteraceae bacterium]MBC2754464.1 DEAD/DEAH box helicase [Desulfobacteraceae bacterium]
MSFENLGLTDHILKAVRKMGFADPTLIQEKVIPEIINGDRDLVGLAQTGTGKTAAFGLPMIQLINFNAPHTQGVVICPTRELCIQISGDFKEFSRYIKGAKIVSVYGGASIENQIRQIKKGAHVIVATPGRLLDLIKRKVVKISNVSFVVLDEADEMLNMGFQEDLDAILSKTPDDKRTWLFSATMPKAVVKIAASYMNDYVEITAGKRNSVAQNIAHTNYVVLEKDRYPALKRIIDYYPDIYGLIFCRTRNETRQVSEKLMKDGYNAEALHGELSQAQRDNVMQKFRSKSIQLLVATDVAARGLDVDDISHVINYNFPDEAEIYTHRSGRTARAGKSGISIVLMNTRERRRLAEVERRAGIRFNYAKVPTGSAICEKQLYAMVSKLVTVDINHEDVGKFLAPVYETLAELPKEELIQRFISIEFNRFLDYYKGAKDINISSKPTSKPGAKKKIGEKRFSKDKNGSFKDNGRRKNYGPRKENGSRKDNGRRKNGDTRSFFINVGQLDNIQKGAIARLLCDHSGISNAQIGKIEILREFSFFEIDTHVADTVLKSMKHAKLDGRDVMVQLAQRRKPRPKQKKR